MSIKNPGAKESILKKIREGLKTAEFKKIEIDEESDQTIYVTQDKPLLELFEEELTKINGEFYLCENEQDVSKKLGNLHNEVNLDLCYSPDVAFENIIGNAKIPYIKEFIRESEIKSGLSACEFLIARFGSVMVSSALAGGRRIFSFPEIHMVVAYENQLVLELTEALEGIKNRYGNKLPSQVTNITGPSRTADIEKTLILGAHGPKRLIVFLIKTV